MTGTITPLRLRGEGQSPLARFDLVAAELLAAGQSDNLQAARIEAILTDLRVQRGDLAAAVADLRGREPTGDVQADAVDAGLVTTIDRGIVRLDLFIARVRVFQNDLHATEEEATREVSAGSARPAPSGPGRAR